MFVEQLACPVCYELFGDRILQCSLGHSICSNCFSKTSLCAQCRQPYTGTRNFLLEEMVKQLIQMKNLTIDVPTKSSQAKGEDVADKLSKQLAKLFESVPKSTDDVEPMDEVTNIDTAARPVILLDRIDDVPITRPVIGRSYTTQLILFYLNDIFCLIS